MVWRASDIAQGAEEDESHEFGREEHDGPGRCVSSIRMHAWRNKRVLIAHDVRMAKQKSSGLGPFPCQRDQEKP